MKKIIINIVILFLSQINFSQAQITNPPLLHDTLLKKITGKPIFDSPKLLNWPLEHDSSSLLDVSEPTSNILNDFHGDISDCEISFSTQGNFHSALAEIWPKYLDLFPKEKPLKNWFYFGGMPIAEKQINYGFIQVGNFKVKCRPQVVLLNFSEIMKLKNGGYLEGDYIPFSKIRGFAFLVKKNNPKKIRSIWDFARKDVHIVTPSPLREPSSFALFLSIIYKMAQLEKNNDQKNTPDALIDKIFNSQNNAKYFKWLAVNGFAHRGVPWSIAYGKGDVSILPYQMAKDIVTIFPELFTILSTKNGEIETLFPSTHVGELFIGLVKGNWSPRQQEAQDKLVKILLSKEFSAILSRHGLDRVYK